MREFENHKINEESSKYGSLSSMKMYQVNAEYWNLEMVYSTETIDASVDMGGDDEISEGSSDGPTKSTLACNMMSLPIESHKNYRKKWNNNLYTTTGNYTIPDWWNTAGLNFVEPDGYFFGKSFSDCPQTNQNIKWMKIANCTKPSVEAFDYPRYTLTEIAKYKDKSKISWVFSRKAGQICKPIKGDFGLTERFGGNWLCVDASVQWSGRRWEVSLTYDFSGDSVGWDKDLYD